MESNEKYASREEVIQAINALENKDFRKLMMCAKDLCRRRIAGTVEAPEDLLQEAFARTLAGGKERNWNKSVSFLKHIDRTMESISSHHAAKQEKRATVPIPEDLRCKEMPPDARAALRDDIESAAALFKDDKVAWDIIMAKGGGASASEIQTKLGISKTEYDSAIKRILRRRYVEHLMDERESYKL